MKYFWPATISIALIIFFLWIMWRSWNRKNNVSVISAPPLAGEVLESFERVFYVSTVRAGEHLSRVQYPGLRYRGYCTIDILSDGVRVQVTGEPAVEIPNVKIVSVGNVQMRIGKVVEKDGMAAIVWQGPDLIESSFRFQNTSEQVRFVEAIQNNQSKESSN